MRKRDSVQKGFLVWIFIFLFNLIALHFPATGKQKMPIKCGSATPPPRIGKIGPYTVFVTPPATPDAAPKPDSPVPVQSQASQTPVLPPSAPRVMAPPAQFDREKPSSFAFLRDTVAKVQNAHASLDEHVAYWFGLNQSKYQWALNDYYENNEKNREAKAHTKKPSETQNV